MSPTTDSVDLISIKMSVDSNGKLHLAYVSIRDNALFDATNASGTWVVSPVGSTGGPGGSAYSLDALMIDGVPVHSAYAP